MKRDFDLVRKILLACEAQPTGYAPDPLEVAEYDKEQIGYHVHLMIQAGLLEGTDATLLGSSTPVGTAQSVTWDGYDFLEASRDDQRWDKAKQAARSVGALTFDVLKSTLVALATAAAKKVVGLP